MPKQTMETNYTGAEIRLRPYLDACDVSRWEATMEGSDAKGYGRSPDEALTDLSRLILHQAAVGAAGKPAKPQSARLAVEVAVAPRAAIAG